MTGRGALRLLFLTKRFPQQRDLIERPYGRFFHLPAFLAELGHDVKVQLISYRRLAAAESEMSGVHWSSHDVLTLGLTRTWRRLADETSAFRPDWIIGCSDTWFGWLAHRLSRLAGTRFAIDAYDNFEAYMPWNFPLHWRWRRAVRAATLVTAAGPHLAARLQAHRRGGDPVEIVPMAPDAMFLAHDRADARKSLGLPAESPLVGYFGGWTRNRGTRALLESFEKVRQERPDVHLVLTGRVPVWVRSEIGAIELGYLEDAQMPLAISAMDVACVITADNEFGRYSYPAKLCEAMACGVPIVATGTDPVKWMLNDDSRFIAEVGNTNEIARLIVANLGRGRIDFGRLPTWSESGEALDRALRAKRSFTR